MCSYTMTIPLDQSCTGCGSEASGRLAMAQRIHAANTEAGPTGTVHPRPAGAIYMGGYCAPALGVVRVAVLGLGANRGMPQSRYFAEIPHCEVVAVCDVYEDATREAADYLEAAGQRRPAVYYGSEEAYLRMLEQERPDAVFIYTPWETHADCAVAVMEHGAHAFVEVPLAATLQDLWRVVDAAERTQKHCMMLENVNYGREELMFLNMVRQGLIGELLHGEAAYLHDLRDQMLGAERGCGSWRTYHYIARNGNLYPTHGLGPVAQYMSIARTADTFDRLVAFSTPALGRAAYARRHFSQEHPWNQQHFLCGDMCNVLIKTMRGRTILVQWDETSPAPYDRRNLIRGTAGTLAGFPLRVAGELLSPPPGDATAADARHCEGWRTWHTGEAAEAALYAKYEHPLYKRLGKEAERFGTHGMDYIMLRRIIECLHRGEPTDQNVYEGALWSAVGPLSEKSVHEGGMVQEFPDFTRGGWHTTLPLGIVE